MTIEIKDMDLGCMMGFHPITDEDPYHCSVCGIDLHFAQIFDPEKYKEHMEKLQNDQKNKPS